MIKKIKNTAHSDLPSKYIPAESQETIDTFANDSRAKLSPLMRFLFQSLHKQTLPDNLAHTL